MKLFIILIMPLQIIAQPFTRGIFGQNYWEYPNTMNAYVTKHIIGWSEAKVVRIGGRGFNETMIAPSAIANIVNEIKGENMLPIVTIPVGTKSQAWPISTIIQNAKDILDALNDTPSGAAQSGPFTKYFIIGNEPDLDLSVNPKNVYAWDVNDIFNYIPQIIAAMEAHQLTLNTSAFTLQFLGPELSSFRNDFDQYVANTYGVGYCNMVDKLTTGSNTNLMTGSSFLDFFTFHYYATADQGNVDPYNLDPTRQNLTQTITQNLVSQNGVKTISSLRSNLTALQSNLASNGSSAGKMIGITEANICTANDRSKVNNIYTKDLLDGNGANSFLAGQFWSEIIGVALEKDVDLINFWSAMEGTSTNDYAENIGYWNTDPGSPYTQTPWTSTNDNEKYTWSHFYALALSLKGTNYTGGNLSSNLKVFGTNYCGGHAIVIMNQSTSNGPQNLVINIGNGSTLGNSMYNGYLKASVDMLGTTSRDLVFNQSISLDSFDAGLVAQIRDEETIIIEFDNCDNPVFWHRIRRGDVAVRYGIGGYPNAYVGCGCNPPFEDPFDPW